MVLAVVSFGYLTDLDIFGRVSVKAVQYHYEELNSTVRFYNAAVVPALVLMDNNAHPYIAVIVDVYKDSDRLRVWNG